MVIVFVIQLKCIVDLKRSMNNIYVQKYKATENSAILTYTPSKFVCKRVWYFGGYPRTNFTENDSMIFFNYRNVLEVFCISRK